MKFLVLRGKPRPALQATDRKGNFRFDINGLRGIAVLAVLCFHYSVKGFSGGFVGVDIFFVISGFLMTKIINSGLYKSNFRIFKFYLRRFARIVPALAFVTLAVLIAGWVIFLPDQYVVVANEATRSLTFSINNYFAARTGYFDPAASESWFLHCWSLAVEFQYYLVLPPVLWVARRISPKYGIVFAITVSIFASLTISFLQTKSNQPDAFYLLPARAWEFAIGGGILFLPKVKRMSGVIAWLGLAMIAGAVTNFTPSLGYPGLWPLLPVLGTALVIWAGSSSIILSNFVLQFFGTISYSLYLWHWPLRLAAIYFSLLSTPLEIAAVAIVAICLAWLSYIFIESPLRLAFNRYQWTRTSILVGLFAITLTGSWLVRSHSGVPSRVAAPIRKMIGTAVYSNDWREGLCFLRPEQNFSDFSPECFTAQKKDGKPRIFIWGDSHAADLYPGIVTSSWISHFNVEQATLSACAPYGTADAPARPHCAPSRPKILKAILSDPPDIVLLTSAMVNYGTVGLIDMLDEEKSVGAQLAELVTKLQAAGIRVIVVGPVPQWDMELPQAFFRYTVRHGGTQPDRLVPVGADRMLRFDSTVRDAVTGAGGTYLSPYAALCNATSCSYTVPTVHGRELLDFDVAHFTEAGSRWVASELIGPALGQHETIDSVRLDQQLEFKLGSKALDYLYSGWLPPESWGSWSSTAEPGVIVLPLDRHLKPEAISITFMAQLSAKMSQERFIVSVSGGPASYLETDQTAPSLTRTIPIGAQGRREIAEFGTLHIVILAPDGRSPRSLGINDDERILGFGLRDLTLLGNQADE